MNIIEMDFVLKEYRKKSSDLHAKLNGLPIPLPYANKEAKDADKEKLALLESEIELMQICYNHTLYDCARRMKIEGDRLKKISYGNLF